MNNNVNNNQLVKYTDSLMPVSELDNEILCSFMKDGDYRSVVCVSETCKTMYNRVQHCSEMLFKTPFLDRLVERAIIVYSLNHYAYLDELENVGSYTSLSPFPDERIKNMWQNANMQHFGYQFPCKTQSDDDLLSYANCQSQRNKDLFLKTFWMVKLFVQGNLDLEDEESGRLSYFFRRFSSLAGCSMLMIKVLLETMKANSQNSFFCDNLAEGIKCVYSDLGYSNKESENYTNFPEHRKRLESIMALHSEEVKKKIREKVLAMFYYIVITMVTLYIFD